MLKANQCKSLDFMNEYFLNKTNIMKIEEHICFISDNLNKEIVNNIEKKDRKKEIQVKQKDVLFWYWYIKVYGLQNYELLGKNVYKKEMEIKTELAEKIHKEKKTFKIFKFKIPEIEQDLIFGWSCRYDELIIRNDAKLFAFHCYPKLITRIKATYPNAYWIITVLNWLRITPYIKDSTTEDLVISSLKSLIDQ